MKRAALFAFVLVVFSVTSFGPNPAFGQPGMLAAAHISNPDHVPPNQEELASLGCITLGTVAVLATGATGVVVLAATGGAAAAYGNLTLPVLGTAFAAGCGVGILAGPGAAWLIEHFDHLRMEYWP